MESWSHGLMGFLSFWAHGSWALGLISLTLGLMGSWALGLRFWALGLLGSWALKAPWLLGLWAYGLLGSWALELMGSLALGGLGNLGCSTLGPALGPCLRGSRLLSSWRYSDSTVTQQ
jgi:hypothetical protein